MINAIMNCTYDVVPLGDISLGSLSEWMTDPALHKWWVARCHLSVPWLGEARMMVQLRDPEYPSFLGAVTRRSDGPIWSGGGDGVHVYHRYGYWTKVAKELHAIPEWASSPSVTEWAQKHGAFDASVSTDGIVGKLYLSHQWRPAP